MKRVFILALALSLLTLLACGKKEVKKQSEDSKTATEAISVVHSLREAYVASNTKLIEAYTTKEGYRTITSSIRKFDFAELEFNPLWIEIEGTTVSANISWKGKWRRGERDFQERGMAVFVLTGRPLKVDNILRASPFVYPD